MATKHCLFLPRCNKLLSASAYQHAHGIFVFFVKHIQSSSRYKCIQKQSFSSEWYTSKLVLGSFPEAFLIEWVQDWHDILWLFIKRCLTPPPPIYMKDLKREMKQEKESFVSNSQLDLMVKAEIGTTRREKIYVMLCTVNSKICTMISV